ncbi:MAG: ParA family protein [Anaerolineae bacterium]|nr:ParA family protein [Anaerolineae bacterium]
MAKASNAANDQKRLIKIVVASHKGGVGKTTTTAQLGTGLSDEIVSPELGYVFLVDGDPQGHLGQYLGIGSTGDFADALLGKKPIPDCLAPIEAYSRLLVMRGNESTWEMERKFIQTEGKRGAQPLSKRLDALFNMFVDMVDDDKMALVIMDTAPSHSEIQIAALMVADYILCPFVPSLGGEMGTVSIWEWVRALKNDTQDGSKGFAVLPQMYDRKDEFQRRAMATMQHIVGPRVLPGIPYNSALARIMDTGMTVWEIEPLDKSPAAPAAARYTQVMEHLAKELGLTIKHKRESK